jgi:hypothetical protein
MTELSALLKATGHSEQSVHGRDLDHARALIGRGVEPLAALGRAAILNALDDGHATLEEIEDAYGEDAVANVYGYTAPENVGDDARESREGDGSGAAQELAAKGEYLRRAGEGGEGLEPEGEGADGPGDDDGGDESAGAEGGEGAADENAAGSARRPGVASRLAALGDYIAAELHAIAAELEGEEADEAAAADGSRAAPVIVETADDIARAGERVHAEPSEAQKAAGNYQKAHIKFDGFDITIENPKGSIRTGLGPTGKQWQTEMPAAYGYLKRSTGNDGDHVDVYLADSAKPGQAFIIDQIEPQSRAFDEHKVVLGAATKNEARDIFVKAFSDGSGPRRIGAITRMSTEQFKEWLRDGDQTRPFAKRLS